MKDFEKKLRKDWLIQEMIINVIPVPASAYFVSVCSKGIMNNMMSFLILVQVAVVLCLSAGIIIRKQSVSKIMDILKDGKEPRKEDIIAAKIQAMRFPFVVSFTVFLRWAILANAVVFAPLFMMGKIPLADYCLISLAMFCAAIGSIPSCFLLSENVMSYFLWEPGINEVEVPASRKVQLRITGKIILILSFCLLALALNFTDAIIMAGVNGIALSDIKLGFVLLIFQSFFLTMMSGIMFSNNISLFLGEILAFFENIANNEGNLKKSIAIGSNDEIGDLAMNFNKFLSNLRFVIRNIKTNSGSLDEMARQLATVSNDMTGKATHSSEATHSIASSSEEMDANLGEISRAIGESASNINTIAVSTDMMASSIQGITDGTRKAKQVTDSAVSTIRDVKSQVDELGLNISGISEMTSVISEISDQTHLLSLNATIEAARAGEAGKGFTIVANEIKELSRQTAEATKKITTMVDVIQSSSGRTITRINDISTVITEVNSFVSSITQDIEGQQNATGQIATMISDSSDRNQGINQNTTELTVAVHDIVKHISNVNLDVNTLADDSRKISDFGKVIADHSAQLMSLVSRFEV